MSIMTLNNTILDFETILTKVPLSNFQNTCIQKVTQILTDLSSKALTLEELQANSKICSLIIIDNFCTTDFLKFSSITQYAPCFKLGKYNILDENNIPNKKFIEVIYYNLIPSGLTSIYTNLLTSSEKHQISRILFFSKELQGDINKINAVFGKEFLIALAMLWYIANFFEQKLTLIR